MIEHYIADYLRDRLDHEIRSGSIVPDDPQEMVFVRNTGGETRDWPDQRSDASIQVIAYSGVAETAMGMARDVWYEMREKFHFTLTAPNGYATDTGEALEDVRVVRMSATGRPSIVDYRNSVFAAVGNYTIRFPEGKYIVPSST